MAWAPTGRDTLFVVLGQRILKAWKPRQSLFVYVRNVPKPPIDDTIGFSVEIPGAPIGRYIATRVHVLCGPAGVRAFGDSGGPGIIHPTNAVYVVIPATANTGRVAVYVRDIYVYSTDKTGLREAVFSFRITQPVGVKHALEAGLRVFPIPAANNINFRFSAGLPAKEMQAEWVDALGRQLGTSQLRQQINVLQVPQGSGIIWLRLSTPGQATQTKAVMRQ